MTVGFVGVPDGPAYWLVNATVPAAFLSDVPAGADISTDGLAHVDVAVRDGRVAGIAASGASAAAQEPRVEVGRGQLWPCLIDVHTHLDKGHTWERAPNPDGTFAGALRAVGADRAARWSAEDVRRRMDFG